MPNALSRYVISEDRTALNTARHLKKSPLTIETAKRLVQTEDPRIVVANRFGGRSLGDEEIFIFPRYKRWTFLISPDLGDLNLAKWYGIITLHLILNRPYRPLQYMGAVRQVIWDEAKKWADEQAYDDLCDTN